MTPDGWRRVTAADLAADEQNSFVIGPFGSDLVVGDYRAEGVPVVFVRDVKANALRWKSQVFVSPDKAEQLHAHRVSPGDVVITKMGLPAGVAAVYPDKLPAGIVTADIIRLRPDKSVAVARYVSEALNAPFASEQVATITGGQTRPKLTLRDYKRIQILLPPLGEQRRIAAILSSVDDAIEATQEVIDQLQVVKKAMMAELLTRGLPEQQHQLKALRDEWRLGRVVVGLTLIPDSWALVPIVSVARLESGHTPSRRHPEYWDGDIPWISLHDSKRLDVPEIYETAQTIGPLGLENSSARLLPAGTVVFSRTATVGKAAIMGREMCTSQDFANYVCGDRLHNRYLMHLFRHMQPEWERLMAGSTHQTIYMPTFRDLQILLPPLEEQKKIAHIVDTLEARVAAERVQLPALRSAKSALISVLLTGKVRVTPDEAAA